jgi:hypothetical protein
MAIDKLDGHGITTFDSLKANLQSGQHLSLTLANNAQVRKLRWAFRLGNEVGWALPLATLVLAIAGIAVAVNRRRTLVRMAAGASIVLVIFIAVLVPARSFFISHAKNFDPHVTRSLWDIVTRYLRDDLYLILLVSLVVLLAAVLAGPARWAVATRRGVMGAVHWVGSKLAALRGNTSAGEPPRWATGIIDHAVLFRAVGLVIAGAIIIFGSPSVTEVWVTLLVLAAYLVLLECALAWARRIRSRFAEATPSSSEVAGTGSVSRP